MCFSLNYNCPNKCAVLPFYGLICDNLEFPLVKCSKTFTAVDRIQRNTIFKHEKNRVCKGRFFNFFKFMSLAAAKKLVL